MEGPAVCVDGKTEPGGDSPTRIRLCPKVEPQVPPLRYAPVGMTNFRAVAHLGMSGAGWTESKKLVWTSLTLSRSYGTESVGLYCDLTWLHEEKGPISGEMGPFIVEC